MLGKKLFIVVNVDWFFLSHRLPIAVAAINNGYDVTILAIEEEGKGDEIRSHGLRFIALPSTRGGTNIYSEFKLLRFLISIYRKEKPDIVHHVAIKPVLYGTIAARISGIPKIINAISGLGSLFLEESASITNKFVKLLYKYVLRSKSVAVIIQNNYDKEELMALSRLDQDQFCLIEGSGVELRKYPYSIPNIGEEIIIVLASRLLWDKGIAEFVNAAKEIKAKFRDKVKFILAGKLDPQNISAISRSQIANWEEEGLLEYVGFISDMYEFYKTSDIVVLPSYREGLPKSLIEAMAVGRPIITTDVPGCNSVVINNVNGFLVKVKSVAPLVNALNKLILDTELRLRMGEEGRKLVVNRFSLKIVVDKTMNLYR